MSSRSLIQSFSAALLERKEIWALLTAILGGLLTLLLLAEIVLQLALRKGWSTHPDFDLVSAVAVDRQGRAWASGYRQNLPALMLYPQDAKPVEIMLPPELARTAPSALMIDSQGRLWVGSEEGMVGMRETDGRWVLYTPENFGTDFFSIHEMVVDGRGRVWVRSHRGPGEIDPSSGKRTFSFMSSGLAESNAVALATDPNGQLWVLTLQRELKVLEPDGSWRTFTTAPTTVRNSIYGSFLTFDEQGQIWLATGGGVGVLRPDGSWTEYPLGHPSRPLSMRAILLDQDGRVWVAGSMHGLFRFDPDTGWTNFTNRNSGLFSDVNALAIGEQGRLWAGSSQGRVNAFNPDAALSVTSLSTIRIIARTMLPAALLSVAVLALLAVVSGSPIRRMAEFVLAFFGWFVVAIVLWIYLRHVVSESSGVLIIHPVVVIMPVVNVALMILLSRLNRQMALGALTAFLVNWIVLIVVTSTTEPFGGSPFWQSIFMFPFFLTS